MLIDFMGYSADCLLRGKVELTAPSLTEMLNDAPVIHLTNVILEDLADARRITAETYPLHRDELYAVKLTGPAGSKNLPAGTVPRRLQAQIGPYNVLGRLNTAPGAPPLIALPARGSMLPLADATIAYVVGGILEVRDAPRILINRDLLSWVRAADLDGDADEARLVSNSFASALG